MGADFVRLYGLKLQYYLDDNGNYMVKVSMHEPEELGIDNDSFLLVVLGIFGVFAFLVRVTYRMRQRKLKE